jgi:replication factor C subunit 1
VDTEESPDLLWTDKYRPKKISQIVGNTDNIKRLQSWLSRYQNKESDVERCVLLTGPPGLGKSSSAACILTEYGYQVKEFNASDVRTKTQVEESLYNLIDVKQVIRNAKPIAIIMDEIDGMSGGDKGGLGELIRYINPNRGKGNRKKEDQETSVALPPIICICNNITDKKLQDFRKDCLELPFTIPAKKDMEILLTRICKAENLKLDEDAIELVIEYSQGDYRRLVTYLQALDSLAVDSSVILGVQEIEQCNYIIGEKSLDMNLETGVKHLITHPELTAELSLQVYNSHKTQYICNIYENYVQLASEGPERVMAKLNKISDVIDDISWSDMVDKIMHKNQLWYLHRIHGILSCHLVSKKLHSKSIHRLNYSSSWSKFNLQRSNEKDIYNLSSRLKTVTGQIDVQNLSQIILHNILESNGNEETIKRGVELLKAYGLDHTHIKTLIKIDRLSEHSKYTTKIERILKSHFPEDTDKSPDIIIKKR